MRANHARGLVGAAQQLRKALRRLGRRGGAGSPRRMRPRPSSAAGRWTTPALGGFLARQTGARRSEPRRHSLPEKRVRAQRTRSRARPRWHHTGPSRSVAAGLSSPPAAAPRYGPWPAPRTRRPSERRAASAMGPEALQRMARPRTCTTLGGPVPAVQLACGAVDLDVDAASPARRLREQTRLKRDGPQVRPPRLDLEGRPGSAPDGRLHTRTVPARDNLEPSPASWTGLMSGPTEGARVKVGQEGALTSEALPTPRH